MKTIHVLDIGFPLCMFTMDEPRKWPEGHMWIDVIYYQKNREEDIRRYHDGELCLECHRRGAELRTR